MTRPELIIVGASGAGRRLIDIALDMLDTHADIQFTSVAVVDDAPKPKDLARLESTGTRYVGRSDQWLSSAPPSYFSIGVGDTAIRQQLASRFLACGHTPATLIAPTARISRSATIGKGCAISPGVDVSASVSIGDFTHVMANSAVSHDCRIGTFSNINPGAVVAGNCNVGDDVTIGAGSTIIQGLTVGRSSIVGAGACVTRNVPPNTVVKGVPARPW